MCCAVVCIENIIVCSRHLELKFQVVVSPWLMTSPMNIDIFADRLIPSFIGMEIWREKSDEQIYNWPKWFLFCLCINGQLLHSAIHGWINHRIWISAVATYTQQHGTSSSVPPKRFRRTQIWIWCLFTIDKRQNTNDNVNHPYPERSIHHVVNEQRNRILTTADVRMTALDEMSKWNAFNSKCCGIWSSLV